MWYGFRNGSGGATGGRGDIGAFGMLPYGIGGGGTNGATTLLVRGGERMSVLIKIEGTALGFSFEGTETFLGAAVMGTGYELFVTTDGRRPGCEVDRLRPVVAAAPRLAIVFTGKAACCDRSSEVCAFNGDDGEVVLILR